MTSPKIPRALEHEVRERASGRCEYCQTPELLSGQPAHIDHIRPRVRGGPTQADNLCLACAPCNSFKLDQTEAIDPDSGEALALFNPRQQQWQGHFAWDESGTMIMGLTPTGRATVMMLKMNRPLIVAARAVWVSVNRHPPKV